MSASGPRRAVVEAKQRLAERRDKLRKQHDSGSRGIQVCAHLTDMIDAVVHDLYLAALDDLNESHAGGLAGEIALVPHGGYGRRDIAPYSDVDLMLLHQPDAEARIAPLAQRLMQDIFDAGLDLGLSVRTPAHACFMARQDPRVLTSLAESRFIGGSVQMYTKYIQRFRRETMNRQRKHVAALGAARRKERQQYGESAYLLQPNIKRSRGGLRDIQLVRWVGFTRTGETRLSSLRMAGLLSEDDYAALRAAREFLLRLRNELHFHAGKSNDIFTRPEQVRIAEMFECQGRDDALPVEEFMRAYFEHTGAIRHIMTNFVASSRTSSWSSAVFHAMFSHQVEGDFRVSPRHISATRRGLKKVQGDIAEVLRLMDLSNLYHARIDHATWNTIRESMLQQPTVELTTEANERFLSMMGAPGRLGGLLRRLHELRVLEQIVPAMRHARCLMQFNSYHKYTIDEHCIRAVEAATSFLDDNSPLGEAYRGVRNKSVLHLALLVHDLGKGFDEDHSIVGERLAGETAARLQLPEQDAEMLQFLVREHLTMAHLALWRDIHDAALVVQFAADVGSPQVLRMLYVLTCADLAAVGPGVLNEWKLELITELYHRTMRRLTGSVGASGKDAWSEKRKSKLREYASGNYGWWRKQVNALPPVCLELDREETIVSDLHRLYALPADEAFAYGRYRPELDAVEYTIGCQASVSKGLFHRLTGALTAQGMQILSAEINTLADGLVLDRFYVHDGDFSGEPPQNRIEEISEHLVSSMREATEAAPGFRKMWQPSSSAKETAGAKQRTRVVCDNSTSDRATIIDVFAHDRMGLLYAISKTIYELDVVIVGAKIGAHLDQVVDVFYVTDAQGQKIESADRIREIRAKLLQAIEQFDIEDTANSTSQ